MILNSIMYQQRELFLKENPGSYANGFYSRPLFFNNYPLNLNIPCTRKLALKKLNFSVSSDVIDKIIHNLSVQYNEFIKREFR